MCRSASRERMAKTMPIMNNIILGLAAIATAKSFREKSKRQMKRGESVRYNSARRRNRLCQMRMRRWSKLKKGARSSNWNTLAAIAALSSNIGDNSREKPENRVKIYAHRTVRYAIKTGKLAKQKCEICEKPNAFAHHDNYAQPLKVKWLCNFHHSEYHRRLTGG